MAEIAAPDVVEEVRESCWKEHSVKCALAQWVESLLSVSAGCCSVVYAAVSAGEMTMDVRATTPARTTMNGAERDEGRQNAIESNVTVKVSVQESEVIR